MSGPDDEADGSGTRLVDFISVIESAPKEVQTSTTYMNSGCRQETFGPARSIVSSKEVDLARFLMGFMKMKTVMVFRLVSGRGHMVTALGASKLGDVRKVYFHDSARSGKFGAVNQERQTTSFLETATVEPMR